MVKRWTGDEAKQVVQNNELLDQAYIDLAQSDAPSIFRKVTIDLTTAKTIGNPYKLGFAYKSVFAYSATDSSTLVNLTPFKGDDENAGFPLTKNGVLNFDKPIKNAFLTWDAQSGKSITLYFILNGSFRPGSLFTEVSSSVEGNAISVPAPIIVTTTVAVLVNENLNRTVLNLDLSAKIYIAASAGATYWFPILAGIATFKNTAAIYAKTLAGTSTVNILEES